MKYGLVKVAAATPDVKVGDVKFNIQKTLEMMIDAEKKGVKLVVFPELGITAYSCYDLFLQNALAEQALAGVCQLAKATEKMELIAIVGLPLAMGDKLYNAAAFLHKGEIIGFATKANLPNYNEFCEQRYFSTLKKNTQIEINGKSVPVGPKLLFCSKKLKNFRISAEICEDMWSPNSPGIDHALNGATVLANLSASNEFAGKGEYRKTLINAQSFRCVCAYIYANAGQGESTTDLVFSGHNLIYECGNMLAESKPFDEKLLCTDIDLEKIVSQRRKLNSFQPKNDDYFTIMFDQNLETTHLERTVSTRPFVSDNTELTKYCQEIFAIQYHGLKKRLTHIGLKTVTIGISGGLDSTLALLVTAKAFDSLNLPRSGIIAVTMPCFGTSNRTYNNAKILIEKMGATFKEIDIKNAVTNHLNDIEADINNHDVTYENAQARERTQVLMDVANKTGGIVVGTGDLSELALGFATYNGDHMSMYGVNASVPKTLMQDIVKYVADYQEPSLKDTLYDIVNTPISPELLPPDENDDISQQTEDIVGPYELHDFYLYYMIRWGFSKEKILHLAKYAFSGTYTDETIEKWLDIFMKRFFRSQFKRSCLPDGPKATGISLSPRGDWHMPSDATDKLAFE
ncbi:MAG: NAD(+) synthase [Clostridia bacterium]|nr:NAD(+) synthase [Clostridia bacterium]